MDARNLSEIVDSVKSSMFTGSPLSESLGDSVAQHDRTRCIAKIALEGLWNGEGPLGWIAPKTFWDMVAFIWHSAPDFFVADDSGRAINENSTCWDQKYLDVQRNYLRHNFSLRRLCHLVMIYEYLHGVEAAEKQPSPPPREEPRSTYVSLPQSSRPKRSFLGGAITVGCLILMIVVSTILIKGRTPTPPASNPPGASKDGTAEQVVVVSAPVEAELTEEGFAVKTPSQDEMKGPTETLLESASQKTEVCKDDNAQHLKSNDVENTSIALQNSAPETERDPVHRANTAVTKELKNNFEVLR